MVTYLVYAPISFFFDSVATASLKAIFWLRVILENLEDLENLENLENYP